MDLPLVGVGVIEAVEQAPQQAGCVERHALLRDDVPVAPHQPLAAQLGAKLPQRAVALVHLSEHTEFTVQTLQKTQCSDDVPVAPHQPLAAAAARRCPRPPVGRRGVIRFQAVAITVPCALHMASTASKT